MMETMGVGRIDAGAGVLVCVAACVAAIAGVQQGPDGNLARRRGRQSPCDGSSTPAQAASKHAATKTPEGSYSGTVRGFVS